MRNVPCRAGGGVLIVVSNVSLPTFVYVRQQFLLQVGVIELPDDLIRYCGTFYSGQDYFF